MELIAILFLIGLGYGVKGLADNVRGDLRKSREAKVKEATKAAGGKLPKHQRAAVARRHTRGWWAREVAGGFPAARTGWHAGWIAHKTAVARQQVIREEARTEHAETQTSFRKELAEHQKRQAAARAELERELAAQQAKGSAATGKSAVQKAADEVSRKREEKAARERRTAPLPATGAETAVPPLPADGVGVKEHPYAATYRANVAEARADHDRNVAAYKAEMNGESPVVIDTPVRVHNAEDSSWLRPGEPRCEGCGGRGGLPGGTCPACRGFGSAPADPNSPLAAPGAICGACGNPGRPGDPVLAAEGGYLIHRSHATEQTGAYREALKQMYPDDGEIDDAVIAADHGYEGEFELAASPTTTEGAPVSCTVRGCQLCREHCAGRLGPDQDCGEAGCPLGSSPDAARNPQPISGSPASPTTEGAPVTDTNYTAVLADAKAAADQAEQDAITATQRRVTAENHADAMQAANVKGNCLSAQMDFVDRLKAQETAAKASGEQAVAVSDHLQREHGGIQAAVDDAPISEPAEPAFYGGS